MSIDFGNLGYTYTRDLCTAIERYTARKVNQNQDTFHYRGMNLQYAVERQLYIKCINSTPLFTFYANLQSDVKRIKSKTLDTLEAEIANELPGADATVPAIRFGVRNLPGYFLLSWLYKQLRSYWSSKRSLSSEFELRHPPVLFHVVHPKFATYLKPVVHYLAPDQYAYLITVDPNLAPALKSLGEPYVSVAPRFNNFHSVLVNKTLRHFYGLVDTADRVYAAISRVRPRCVVVVEGNAPLDVITAEVCVQFSIPVFCIQQGWSPVVHSGFRNLSFDDMFVWGDGFAKMLAPYNPRQHFTVTGNPIIQQESHRSERSKSDPMMISFFLQSPCALLSASNYGDFIELIIWCARKYTGVQIVVREHPSYPVPAILRDKMNAHDNIVFSSPVKDSLVDVIRGATLVVSVFSTVLLEAVALGTVPLICSIGSMPHYEPDLAGSGAAIEVHSVEEARQVINQVVCEPGYLDRYKSRLGIVSDLYFSKGNAASTISNKIKVAASLSLQSN